MTLTTTLTERAATFLGNKTSRRGFLTRTAMVGSALTVAGTTYATKPGTAYAAVCTCNNRSCDCNSLCCDGYTEFCCRVYGENSCPPNTILAGWWKVDNSHFCAGAARYYMDCNKSPAGCSCGSGHVCRGGTACQCRSCDNRKDGCTVFRYGNCNNHVSCVGPIMCRVVTCAKPWEIDPGCSTVARTDNNTRYHHRQCLVDPKPHELAFVEALYRDYLGRPSDSGRMSHANRMVQYRGYPNKGRETIARAFAYSSEHLGVVVNDLYQMAFERNADPGGKRIHVDAVRDRRMTQTDVALRLLSSGEFYSRSGSTPEGFVRRLYERVLGRTPAPSEIRPWADRLAAGWSRRRVAKYIYNSRESRHQRVHKLYQQILGRPADSAGLKTWSNALLTKDDIVVSITLAGSREYYSRAQKRFA